MDLKAQTIEVGAPMDNDTFLRWLRSGKVPVRLTASGTVNYDLKFVARNAGRTRKTNSYRIHFGQYFRDPALKATSMTLGSGTPYKTESIIVLLDPPPTNSTSWAISAYTHQKQEGRSEIFTVGDIGSRALIELLFSTAKEVGIGLYPPKKPDESLEVSCSLIPMKKGDTVDNKICILQIDEILHR